MMQNLLPSDPADLDQSNNLDLRGSWYEIDQTAIAHNYNALRRVLPSEVKIYACLKRNGYGCGAGVIAGCLAQQGIDGFAVASLADALAIRRHGIGRSILLYPGCGFSGAPVIEANDLTITVSSLDELQVWKKLLRRPRFFLKVDLGFCRAGATPAQALEFLTVVVNDPAVDVIGIYAHLSELPSSGAVEAQEQLERMRAIADHARAIGLQDCIVMMSSTDGVLNYPQMDFQAVDPGALIVGAVEARDPVRRLSLRPALSKIASRLVGVKELDLSLGSSMDRAGFRVGMRMGVMALGWGDGYPRDLPKGAFCLVRGKRARILPPVHLEHLRIDLSDIPEARFGDEVVLLGGQGAEVISHAEVATQWRTDIVGLYGRLRDHIPRKYI